MRLTLLISLVFIQGCAVYLYESEDCQLSIYSMKGFEGVHLELDKDCSLQSGADTVNSDKAIEIIDRLVK